MVISNQQKRNRVDAEPIEVHVHDLAHDGRGIGRRASEGENGKTVFVHGALPGEQVTARLIGRNRRFDEAVVQEVCVTSPDRIEPVCPWFHRCGGCALQHLQPTAQVAWKHKRLVDNLARLGGVKPMRWAEPIVGNPWGYRRRARLSVRYVRAKDRVLVGFREKQGRYVADIEHCPVLDVRFSECLNSLSELIGTLSIKQAIPQIEVAAGEDSAALIIRHLEPLTSEDVERLKDWSDQHQLAIYLQAKGPDSIHLLAPPSHHLSYSVDRGSLRFSFQPQQFIQVNAAINGALIERALAWLSLTHTDRVLDLYCGLGNFSLPIAKRAGSLIGIEGAEDLVISARANAQHQGVDNAEFYVADLTLPAHEQPWMGQAFDAVLIDPPRSGAEEVLPLIGQSKSKRVVYVSCNPATLARDAGLLVREHGYRLVEAGIADMFPHTAHVESIALFERTGS